MSDKSQFALVAVNAADIEMMLIESGGDMTPELQEKLNSIKPNIDLSASMIERCGAHAEHFRKKARAFAEIAQGFEKSESYLKQIIKDDMQAHGVSELLGKDVRFKLSPSKPKLVIDEETLDSAYQMHVLQPDKKKIEEDLALGVPVQGARLEETKSLRTYLIKKVEK